MSQQQNNNFTVKLLERAYTIKCSQAEVSELQKAADYLQNKLSAIRQNYANLSREEVAMMVALNMSYELLTQTQAGPEKDKAHEVVVNLSKKIEEFLTQT
jgi:cell division protein ZapA